MHLAQFSEAFPGNLISPSRGVLIYVPTSLFVLYLVVRYWRYQPHPRLVWLTAGVSAGHLAAVSCFIPWYGGECYGPRYTTELVPWFVLLAALGTRAALSSKGDADGPHGARAWHATLATGGVLLLLSGLINWRGANSVVVEDWNRYPASVDAAPARVWDWRHPQILAGIIASPEPAVFPLLDGNRVPFGNEAGRAFQWDGWSASEPEFCWTEDYTATLVFTANDLTADRLRLCFRTYLHGQKLHRQRIRMRLNDQPIAAFTVYDPENHEYVFTLPPGILQRKNVLTIKLPDASSPYSMNEGADDRKLGIALRWLELKGKPATGTPAP